MRTLSSKRSTHVITGAGERAHVVVATLSGRSYQNAFADSRQEAVLHALETGLDLTNLHIGDCRIDDARNFAVAQLMEAAPPADFLVFFDDDMLLPYDVLPRLVADARTYNADVVGCLYTSRSIPSRLIVIGEEGPIDPELGRRFHAERAVKEVIAVGMGATLIRASIFGALDRPYFFFEEGAEDYSFCRRVRLAAGKVVCDFSFESRLYGRIYPGIAHLGVYPYSILDAETRVADWSQVRVGETSEMTAR